MSPPTDFQPDQLIQHSFLRHVEFRAEVESTNNLALNMAADPDLATPLLVLAQRQTAGRGRGSNRWWSADGALTFSLILQEPIVPSSQQDWPRISLATAVALCAAVEDFLPQTKLGVKWPNDVFVDGRKIAGILVEVPNAPNLPHRRVVVGIGLNVNNSWRGAPSELQETGAAMCDLVGNVCDPQQILLAVLQQIEVALTQLVNGDKRLNSSWQSLSILDGRRVEVDLGQEVVQGECRGIDEEGALVVENATGTQRLFGGVIKSFSEY